METYTLKRLTVGSGRKYTIKSALKQHKNSHKPLIPLDLWLFPLNRNDRIRTCDLFVPNEALYQAEPHSVNKSCQLTTNNSCIISELKTNCTTFFQIIIFYFFVAPFSQILLFTHCILRLLKTNLSFATANHSLFFGCYANSKIPLKITDSHRSSL